MEYKRQPPAAVKVKPRLIIHSSAGNIKPSNLAPPEYEEYYHALLTIIAKTSVYQTTPLASTARLPSALDTAAHTVSLLEDNPLFNSRHGAVFTQDGVNKLKASVMVSHSRKKRGVGVTGLRRVRSLILLAKAILKHGDKDLTPSASSSSSSSSALNAPSDAALLNVPGA